MDAYEQIKNTLGPLRVLENEPLSKHTYFKIGGPARLFFEAKNVEDLKLAIATAFEQKVSYVVLGGGANVLVSDKGFNGLVIRIQNTKYEIKNNCVQGTHGADYNATFRHRVSRRHSVSF